MSFQRDRVPDPALPLSLGAADLYQLAQNDPDMWAAIAAHPNAYPDLLDWLERVGAQPVKDVVAERRKPPSPSPSPGNADLGVDRLGDQPPTDRTVLAKRSKRAKTLALLDWGGGVPTLIVKEQVVIGRRVPQVLKTDDTQIVELEDVTKTVSAKHARLKRVEGKWFIEDLGSTNGIYLVHADGGETEVEELEPVTEEFYLGDVLFHLEHKG